MIIRTEKNQNFSKINNTVLRDTRLSWRARGIAAYLLTMPDDWQIDYAHLWKNGVEGRDAVLTAMKELEECGYLIRTKLRKEDGTFTTFVTLHEQPQEQPTTDYQKSVNQESVNQMSVNQESRIITKDQQLIPITDDDEDNARAREHGAVFTAWSENIPGTMTPILGEKLHDLIDECGPPAVIHGIVTSVEAGARNFKYIAACARNHAQGRDSPATQPRHRKPYTNGSAPRQTAGEEAVDSFFARLEQAHAT